MMQSSYLDVDFVDAPFPFVVGFLASSNQGPISFNNFFWPKHLFSLKKYSYRTINLIYLKKVSL